MTLGEVFAPGVIAQDEPFQVSTRVCASDPVLFWPTAWQKEGPAHDSERSRLPMPVEGCGVVTSVQALPFHTSEKGALVGNWTSVSPTARHQEALVQSMLDASETGVGKDPLVGGVCAGTAVRADPFHWLPNTSLLPLLPRISQDMTEAQPTEVNSARAEGVAGVTRDQSVPFHVSATARPKLDPPTARQKVVPTHDTETSPSPLEPGTFGLGTVDHDEPFHTSASVPPPAPRFWVPTAMQKVEVVHDTEARSLGPLADAASLLDQLVAFISDGLDTSLAPVTGAPRSPAAVNAKVLTVAMRVLELSTPPPPS